MTVDELKEYDTILNDHGNEWDMFAWAARTKVRSHEKISLVAD